ncbi:MAG: cobalamin-dependent protein [Betaproteobacteria bacterium]|nr:cobalamin-dependent protein [Betaproteobacteria bacterium]
MDRSGRESPAPESQGSRSPLGYEGWGQETDIAERLAFQNRLKATIESELIPRLMLMMRVEPPFRGLRAPGVSEPFSLDPEIFARRLLSDEDAACAEVERALRDGRLDFVGFCERLVVPTARLLGAMWVDDSCDFTQVTLAVWRLQRLVAEHEQSGDLPAEPAAARGRILLSSMPGAQHSLGLSVLAGTFRRDGWDVHAEPGLEPAALTQRVAASEFHLVGLSASLQADLEPMRSVIIALRQSSRNPAVGVMVGGPLLLQMPNLSSRVGADLSAPDAASAVTAAQAYLAARHRQS